MTTIETPVPARPRKVWALAPAEWQPLVTASIIALAPLPWLTIHAQELGRRPHYQYYPLVIPGALLLGWNALRQPIPPGSVTDRSPKRANLIAVLGLLLLVVGVVFISPWLATIATLLNLLALIDSIGGTLLMKRLLPAWGFLWLAIPPPRGPDDRLLSLLQGLATRWSSAVLDRIGVIHVIEGNVIEIVGRRLFVEEACSGINSLFTLILGTLFIAAWTRSRPMRAIILVAASVVWVLTGNVVRIVVIAYADARWHVDLSHGWPHTILGICIFMGMLGLVFSTDRLVTITGQILNQEVATVLAYPVRRWRWLIRRGPKEPKEVANPPSERSVPVEPLSLQSSLKGVGATLLGKWSFATVFVLLAAAQVAFLWQNKRDLLRSEHSIVDAFGAMERNDLPDMLGRFRRIDFKTTHRESTDLWGENSKMWTYQSGGLRAIISVDYTFLGWHELIDCYRANGCGIGAPEVVYGADPAHTGRTEVRLTDPEGRFRYLVYGLADYNNRSLHPPRARGFLDAIAARMTNWVKPDNGLGIEVELPSYQFQVLLISESPLTAAEINEAHGLYEQARAVFLAHGPKRHGGGA